MNKNKNIIINNLVNFSILIPKILISAMRLSFQKNVIILNLLFLKNIYF